MKTASSSETRYSSTRLHDVLMEMTTIWATCICRPKWEDNTKIDCSQTGFHGVELINSSKYGPKAGFCGPTVTINFSNKINLMQTVTTMKQTLILIYC